MSAKPVHHQRTEHVEIDMHFVRDKVAMATSEFFMFHIVIKMLTSSRKAFPHRYLMSLDPV